MDNPFDAGYFETPELRTFGFAHIGENVRIAKNCTIVGLGNISIGDGSRIDSGACLFATGGKLTLEGANHIGGMTHLSAAADLSFGEFSGTSQGVRIYTATDDYSGSSLMGPCVPPEYRNYRIAPVRIEKHCSIGSGAVILPGVSMHEGAILGALSLAVRSLKAWTVHHGNPARVVANRSKRALKLEVELKKLRHAP